MHERVAKSFFIFAWACGATTLYAQTPSSTADQQTISEIQQAAAEFTKSFNSHDPQAVAAHFTENGDYINAAGERIIGRASIAKQHETFFADNPEATIHVAIDSIRVFGDTAIEDGRAVIGPFPEGAPAFSKYTVIHVKQNGKWLMASVRDTRIETPMDDLHLHDLDWLVGSWHAERDNVRLDVKCRWMTGRRFLVRTFNLRDGDKVTQSGMQIIGWDPLSQHISSWLFDSTGGHAVGVWRPSESGWAVESHGVTRAGVLTNSVNSFRRVDENSLAWKSVNRTLGGTSIPDIEEVVVTRQEN